MNKKIYDQMNWPEIEGIVYSECDHPSKLLGGHVCDAGFLIQVFRPDAVEIQAHVEGKKRVYQMEKVDEAGYFAVIIPGKKVQKYQLTVENLQGRKMTYMDPYSCSYSIDHNKFTTYLNGCSYNAYQWMGSHVISVDHIKGTMFSVWAPKALRVSVVGEFNHWDGRIHQMNRYQDTGLFTLFLPDVMEGTQYFYEIKKHGGDIFLKSDPYAMCYEKDNRYCSVVHAQAKLEWQDADWQKSKLSSESLESGNRPISILEMKLDRLSKKDASVLADHIKELGFTHVELLPVCEYISETSLGYETFGYFALTNRIGEEQDFAAFVNALHMRGIGIIIDWNAAFMGREPQGMCWFDGEAVYESDVTRLTHSQLNVATFDYAKPEVRSLLSSSLMYWINRFHIDGFRIDEAASMLYLNYGKQPGEWQSNIYGGCENLDAVDFLQSIRRLVNQKAKGALLIAQDNSCWSKVTGKEKDSLGFDYKWNDGWKKDLLSFMHLDPLFRKGKYDSLTHSMLYHYSEYFMLEFSHKSVEWDDADINHQTYSLYDILPGNNKEDKLANLRAMIGYLYCYPGKKLLSQDICKKVPELMIHDLNQIYEQYPQLYESDYETEGFEWVDTDLAEETIIAFSRRASNSQDLLVVTNFTPVVRLNYLLGVAKAGKYSEIFNSDDKKYGGNDYNNEQVLKSEKVAAHGNNQAIRITLPPMSTLILSFTPYTEYELEEISIKEAAQKANELAQTEASNALSLKEKAELEAKEALEAEEKARDAAQRALNAKLEADRKADEAEKLHQQIEAETIKKLNELKKKYNR